MKNHINQIKYFHQNENKQEVPLATSPGAQPLHLNKNESYHRLMDKEKEIEHG